MKKFLGGALYWLSILAGLTGLAAGGKSLGKYAFAWLTDKYFDSFSYNDLIFSGSVIFLLSLILLIFANLSRAVTKHLLTKPEMAQSAKSAATAPAAGTPAALSATPAPPPEEPKESADEKLARLLKQKE